MTGKETQNEREKTSGRAGRNRTNGGQELESEVAPLCRLAGSSCALIERRENIYASCHADAAANDVCGCVEVGERLAALGMSGTGASVWVPPRLIYAPLAVRPARPSVTALLGLTARAILK
jgi:hypothetical protein